MLDVIGPRLHLGADDLGWIDGTADLDGPELPDVVAPHLNGICSSGSTGMPKVILTRKLGVYDPETIAPFMETWTPVPARERSSSRRRCTRQRLRDADEPAQR